MPRPHPGRVAPPKSREVRRHLARHTESHAHVPSPSQGIVRKQHDALRRRFHFLRVPIQVIYPRVHKYASLIVPDRHSRLNGNIAGILGTDQSVRQIGQAFSQLVMRSLPRPCVLRPEIEKGILRTARVVREGIVLKVVEMQGGEKYLRGRRSWREEKSAADQQEGRQYNSRANGSETDSEFRSSIHRPRRQARASAALSFTQKQTVRREPGTTYCEMRRAEFPATAQGILYAPFRPMSSTSAKLSRGPAVAPLQQRSGRAAP